MFFDEFLVMCPKCKCTFEIISPELDGTYCPYCDKYIKPKVIQKIYESMMGR